MSFKQNKHLVRGVVAALFMLAAAPVSQAQTMNLLVNGDFDDPACRAEVPCDWDGSATGIYGYPNFVFFLGHPSLAPFPFISQSVTVTPGVQHELTFTYAKGGDYYRRTAIKAQVFLASNPTVAIADTGLLDPGASPPGTDLTDFFSATLTFTPAEADIIIKFEGKQYATRVFPVLGSAVLTGPPNSPPTAVATVEGTSMLLAVLGDSLNFDGTGSTDPENDPLTYAWTITAAPAGSVAALVDANTATPSLTTDLEGTYEVTLNVSDAEGPGTPDTVEIVAVSATQFAEVQVAFAVTEVLALTPGQVKNGGTQNAFIQQLNSIADSLEKGKTTQALMKLNLLVGSTDGCPLRGTPDVNGPGQDTILDCDAQQTVYDLLTAAINALL